MVGFSIIMTSCIINFFTQDFAYVHHDVVDPNLDVDDDYLSPGESSAEITKTDKVSKGCFVVFSTLPKFLGVVTDIDDNDEYKTTVTFKPWLSLFSHSVRFNTKLQNKTALETVIANLINEYWGNKSTDSSQKISFSSVKATSSTKTWTFGINPQTDDGSYNVVSFYDDLILKAMTKYAIGIQYSYNIQNKSIAVTVGKNESTFTIDADLPNVEVDVFKLHDPSVSTNKLEVWNSENFTDVRRYYLHTDGTYSTTDTKRITPISLEVQTASPEYETTNDTKTTTKTFAQAADEVALETFSGIEYSDDVEIIIDRDDGLINHSSFKMGQIMNLIHKGTQYSVVFTGKKYSGGLVTLMFGSVRSDYTKKIRLEKAGIK